MCRAPLPPGPEQIFEGAARRYVALKREMTGRAGGRWGAAGWAGRSPTAAQEEEAAAVVALWREAGRLGHAHALGALGVFLKVTKTKAKLARSPTSVLGGEGS